MSSHYILDTVLGSSCAFGLVAGNKPETWGLPVHQTAGV